MRTPRPILFMQHAALEATRSTCFRGNVGCVMVHRDSKSIVSTGYNGPVSGEHHCTGHLCEGAQDGCVRSVHAEMNALQKLRTYAAQSIDVYVTVSPCPFCMCRLESDPRIFRVFYQHDYRKQEHLAHSLKLVYRITPAGYITQFGGTVLLDPETFYDPKRCVQPMQASRNV